MKFISFKRLSSLVNASAEMRPVSRTSGYTYAISGRRNEAQKVPERLMEMSKQRYVPPANVAEVYAGPGEQEQALDWLDRACHERDHALVRLVVNPSWDNLRSY